MASLALNEGGKAAIYASGGTDGAAWAWTSSDEAVARVSSGSDGPNPTILAVAAGSCTVTVTRGTKSAAVSVTVVTTGLSDTPISLSGPDLR